MAISQHSTLTLQNHTCKEVTVALTYCEYKLGVTLTLYLDL